MNKKKLFAVVISLALVIGVVLPGTLALSTDQTSSNSTIEVPTETTTPAPDTTETPVPEGTEAPAETPTEEPVKTCTCDPKPAEGEAHLEGCPLYVAPEQPAEAEKTCTCDPKPAEGEAHLEGCPLYVAPEKPAAPSHIDTCSDDCTGEDCKCPCHLFERLMACTTLEEVWIIMDGTSDAEFEALTDEQWDAIDDLIFQLDPINKTPEPPEESEPVVESEIIYPTVNFDEVAPFGDPVVGGEG